MLKFPVYWTEAEKINFLQRIILIHSYLYYEKDNSVWTDKKFDEVAKQLVSMQGEHDVLWIRNKTQYGYTFYDFDGTTGFLLWGRLKKKDKEQIAGIANSIRRWKSGEIRRIRVTQGKHE